MPSLQLHDEVEHVVHPGAAAWSDDHRRFALLHNHRPAQLRTWTQLVAIVYRRRVIAVQLREVRASLAFQRLRGVADRGGNTHSQFWSWARQSHTPAHHLDGNVGRSASEQTCVCLLEGT